MGRFQSSLMVTISVILLVFSFTVSVSAADLERLSNEALSEIHGKTDLSVLLKVAQINRSLNRPNPRLDEKFSVRRYHQRSVNRELAQSSRTMMKAKSMSRPLINNTIARSIGRQIAREFAENPRAAARVMKSAPVKELSEIAAIAGSITQSFIGNVSRGESTKGNQSVQQPSSAGANNTGGAPSRNRGPN